MSNTYNWIVNSLNCYPQSEGQTDVVFTVNWSCVATSSEEKTYTNPDGTTYQVPYTASTYASTGVMYKSGDPYTPYAQLTQSQVIGWVQSALGTEGVANIESYLDTQIANQINPPVVTPPLPWVTPPATSTTAPAQA